MYTLKTLLNKGIEILNNQNIENADIDAWYLLEFFLGIDRTYYILNKEEKVSEEKAFIYLKSINKRATHYPLQYITNTQDFMGYSFKVNENVLIPRQDTETLIEEILNTVNNVNTVLDMCTGSGCIAISLYKLLNPNKVVAVDISKKALEVAIENARILNANVEFINSDLFENLSNQKFDLIVSNPPYIETRVIDTLMEEVKNYEPLIALDGKQDGLYFYRKIIKQAKYYLNENGYLFFEIGFNQGDEIKNLFVTEGFKNIVIKKDLAGLDRIAYANI